MLKTNFFSVLHKIAFGLFSISFFSNSSAFSQEAYDEYHTPECTSDNKNRTIPPSPDMVSRDYEWFDDCHHAHTCGAEGVWLPEGPPLFRPFVADPRAVTYSIGWRFDDQALVKNVIDVSYGDSLPIYQWFNVWPFNAKMRIELEGALWAVFSPCQESSPLINADYYCGIPITFSFDRWAFRCRFFHISSHVGDEFLINHWHKSFKGERFCRFNPSAEYLDFYVSYDLTDDIRAYGGVGVIVHQDESFKFGRFYAETGMELHLRELGYYDDCNSLYGMPFYGMDFRYRRDFKHHIDSTYVLGYEWGKTYGLCRVVRVYMEYHDGYSAEGQFCHQATNYFSIRASYGF